MHQTLIATSITAVASSSCISDCASSRPWRSSQSFPSSLLSKMKPRRSGSRNRTVEFRLIDLDTKLVIYPMISHSLQHRQPILFELTVCVGRSSFLHPHGTPDLSQGLTPNYKVSTVGTDSPPWQREFGTTRQAYTVCVAALSAWIPHLPNKGTDLQDNGGCYSW